MKITILRLLFVILLCALFTANIHAQVTVSGSTGANGTYARLGLAFTAINATAQTNNNIVVTITASTTETASATLNVGTWTSLKIYPAVINLSISGNLAAPLIDLNGADNVTIDGRVGATGSTKDLVITNTSVFSAAGTSTIRFINDATNNTVKYCIVKGSQVWSNVGVIFFSTTTGTTGNDNNTIDNNNITCASDANRPLNAVCSAGTSNKQNSSITISNNNIYNFLNRAKASNGILINSGSVACTISGNSLCETTSFVPTAAVPYTAISVVGGSNITVSGNYIGGSAPLCAGTAWTKTAGSTNAFSAIRMNVLTLSSVQNNTIINFAWSDSGVSSWTAINVPAAAQSNVNIGTLTGNTIGSPTGPITITSGGNNSSISMIAISSDFPVNCQNNVIQSVTGANGGAFATNIYGINKTASAGTTTISNNTIGSTTTANSIISSSTSTGAVQSVYGISNAGTGAITINGNIIANLTNGTTNVTAATSGLINGIYASAGTNTITNNTVLNLTISNTNTSATNTASAGGVVLSSAANVNTVTGNTVYNLSNTNASFAGNIHGIYFTGSTGANVCSGNFIHSLSATGGSSTAASIFGIKAVSGATTYSNNIVNLGGDAKTALYGIYDRGAASQTCNLYHNTVYLGGTLASGSANKSYCMYSAANANIRNYRNNLFMNARSTTAGASLHYAISLTANTNLTCNYNNYWVTGTGGVLGSMAAVGKGTLALWQAATTQDGGSYYLDPVFTVSPPSTIAIDYKIAKDLAGATGTGITADYGANIRATRPTMGAWEHPMVNRWRGATSSVWGMASNWTLNMVPAPDDNIGFDYAPVNHCILDMARSVNNIINEQGTYRMVINGQKLTVKGNLNFTNGAQIDASAASSTLEFAGPAAQAIPAGTFYNDKVYNLTVNNSSNVTLNGTLNLLNTITATAGRLDATTTSPTVIYGGTAPQTIDGSRYLSDRMYNLTIDNAVGATVNANITVDNTLTINAGKLLKIGEAKQLTASGVITNNSGATGLVINSSATGTGSLLHNTSAVPATVNRYFDGVASAWHFLSSPVDVQDISGVWKPAGTYGDGTGYDLYVWDEPTSCWIYNLNTTVAPTWTTVHPQTNFVPGRGYLYAMQATTPTQQFIGNLNNGEILYSLTANATGVYNGFNLVGNAYPSSIDWKAPAGFTRGMLYVNGSGNDIWIWNSSANNYGVYNSADVGDNGTNGVTRYIAPMQGFFVRAASAGNFGMDNATRTNTGASAWKVAAAKVTDSRISVTVQSATGAGSDEVRFDLGNAANENGALKIFSPVKTAPSLYLPSGSENYSVRHLTDTVQNKTVALNFKAGKTESYTLKCVYDEAAVDTIYLEDKVEGIVQNLGTSNIYTYTATTEDKAARFVLHFNSATATETSKTIDAKVYCSDRKLIIDLEGFCGDYTARITDISGRTINQINMIGGQRVGTSLNTQGVYVVSLSSATDRKKYKIVNCER